MDWLSCAGVGVGILGLAFAAWASVKMRRLKSETASPSPDADISDYMPVISNPDEANQVKKAISDLLGEKQRLQQEKTRLAADRDAAHQKISDLEKTITDERQKRELAEGKARSAGQTNAELQEKNKNLEGSLNEMTTQAQSANETVEKLESKNKKLNEELGDLEDELDDVGKSLKKEKQLKEELESAKEGLERNLARVNEEKEGLENANKLKASTISFVQDLLSAKETAEYGELQKKVDELYKHIGSDAEDSVKTCLKNNCGIKDGIDKESLESLKKWRSITSKPWLNGKKVIAFIGEFSAGKTSIVNAILSYGNPDAILLPVSTKATTAIPTYIAGVSSGEQANYSFVAPGDICKGISEETFRNVSKETLDEMKGVSSLIKYFVMGYDNKELAGLSILDTPGFSSNDAEDAERTAEVINECDALFWVIDINAGDLNESSKKTLQKVGGEIKIPLYVILNKADTKSKEEIEATLERVRQTFSDAGMEVAEIFPFSSKSNEEYKVEDLMARIGSVHSSNSENTHFIDGFMEGLGAHSKEMDKQVRQAQSQNTSDYKKCDSLDASLGKTIAKLCDALKDISDLPEEKEHWFSANTYVMKQEQYAEMVGLILKAIEYLEKIEEIYKQRQEATNTAKESFGVLKELEGKKRNLAACAEKVKRLASELSALQESSRAISSDDNNHPTTEDEKWKETSSKNLKPNAAQSGSRPKKPASSAGSTKRKSAK